MNWADFAAAVGSVSAAVSDCCRETRHDDWEMTDSVNPVFKPIAFEISLLRARLDRAEEHYKTFGHIWAEYLDGDPHLLDHTAEADGTIAVRLRRAAPLPIELSLAFGELLYELRAALDNCLYAVAVLVSGQNPPPGAGRLEWSAPRSTPIPSSVGKSCWDPAGPPLVASISSAGISRPCVRWTS